jgi:hypothetical protein
MELPPEFGPEMKNTNQKPFERHSETQLTSTISLGHIRLKFRITLHLFEDLVQGS